MTLQRLVKEWEFLAENRSRVVLADPARIRLSNDDPLAPAVELVKAGGLYPADNAANTVTSWEYEPHGLRKLLMFQAVADLPPGTSIVWRVVVGGAELFWDGSAWAPPVSQAVDWSTAAQISTNLPALAFTSRRIAVKANLRASANRRASPRLRSALVLGSFAVEWFDDLIYDTVIRSMQDTLLSTTDIAFAVQTTASVLDLASAPYSPDNPGYNFIDVVSAFDTTADPDCFINLAASYAPGAARPDGTNDPGSVLLTDPVPAGNVLRLTMTLKPEIAVKTDQDYYEVERLPAVAIERVENVRLLDGSEREASADGDGDVIYDATTGAAVRVPPPRQANYRFSWSVFARSQAELQRLVGAVEGWVATHPTLRTWAMDDLVGVDADQSDSPSGGAMDDVRTATGAFMLRVVPFWLRPAEDGHVIVNVNVTFEKI